MVSYEEALNVPENERATALYFGDLSLYYDLKKELKSPVVLKIRLLNYLV